MRNLCTLIVELRQPICKRSFKRMCVASALTILLAISMANVQTFASASQTEIRIGLQSRYGNSTSVPIQNKSILIGYENEKYPLEASNNFSVRVTNDSFTRMGDTITDFEQAMQLKELHNGNGENTVISFLDNGSFALYTKTDSDSSDAKIALYDGDIMFVVFDSEQSLEIQPIDDNSSLTLLDRAYRGKILFSVTNSGSLLVVNLVDIEQYLYSVVPSEMPASWHLEALKAQSVAARTYTFKKIGTHEHEGFDLCDVSHCQNYLGSLNESPRTTQAVNETIGIMAYYNNELIEAVYFSSSGGVTENSENVWINASPYLRSVQEIAERSYREWTRTFTLSEMDELLKGKNIDIGSVMSVSARNSNESGRVDELTFVGSYGTEKLNKEDIRTFFANSKGGILDSRNFTIDGGTFEYIDNESSEDIEINTQMNTEKIITEDVNLVVTNGDMKEEQMLSRLVVTNGNEVLAEISYVLVEGSDRQKEYSVVINEVQVLPVIENTFVEKEVAETVSQGVVNSTGDLIVFVGRGWGHGVGLSQFGAKGMADDGYTYKQILEHYYTGIKVE